MDTNESKDAVAWLPITDAEKDGEPVWLYSTEFVDADFNPTGIVDGFWNDDYGWTIWQWNGCQDCFDTVEFAEPSHFARKVPPVI